MRRVPRRVAAAGAVEVTDLRCASRVARPVVAGVIVASRERTARGCRARQNVVLIQRLAVLTQITGTLDDRAASRSAPSSSSGCCRAAQLDRVAMQVRQVAGDDAAARVGPRTLADAVARVDGARALRAQIRAPPLSAGPGLS